MKKLGKKMNLEEQTIEAYIEWCIMCSECACNCGPGETYSSDYSDDSSGEYYAGPGHSA